MHGFLPVEITPDQYIFGSQQLGGIVLQHEGQWDDYLPLAELQQQYGLETMNCTVYGTLNCIETLFKRMYGKEENYSERFIGVLAETTPSGNNPHKVAETIRKNRVIKDELLPFTSNINTWEKYYSPKPMTRKLLKMADEWMFSVGHDWVRVPGQPLKKENLMEALRYSPLGASVYAWREDERGFYKKPSDIDNHWVMIYGYGDGYWKIYDHYDKLHKKLVWDYDFTFVKRYTLERRKRENMCITLWKWLFHTI